MKTSFAKFYDQIASQKGAKERYKNVKSAIDKYAPNAIKILELGTGNGNVLLNFPKKYNVFGLDVDKNYLRLVKNKIPHAKLYHSSMHNFKINQKMDVIYSVFDSINFLNSINQIKQTINTVHKHLTDKGIFVFDIYTENKLKTPGKISYSKEKFGHTITKPVVKENKLTWNFIIFEKQKSTYKLHEYKFNETIFTEKQILSTLNKKFKLKNKKILEENKGKAIRVFYVFQKQ